MSKIVDKTQRYACHGDGSPIVERTEQWRASQSAGYAVTFLAGAAAGADVPDPADALRELDEDGL